MRYFATTLTCLLACGAAGYAADIEGSQAPVVALTLDRSAYAAGETAWLTLATSRGRPSDVYIVVRTPRGDSLFADAALHFSSRRAAAARDFILDDGEIAVPLSLTNQALAKPGEYVVQAFVAPPGGAETTWELTDEARFVVSLPGLNFKAIHDPSSPQFDYDCASCHVDKTRDVFLAPGIPSFHTLKFRLFNGAQWAGSCTWCHEGADLTDGSRAAARKQVVPEKCNLCHSAFGPGGKLFAKP